MALVWTSLWDRKTRLARRATQAVCREAKILLRRAKTAAPADKQAVQDAVQDAQQAMKSGNPAAMDNARVRLSALVDTHLAHLRRPAWRESAESIAFAVLIALTIRCFMFEVFQIPSGSMIPTLAIGDKILVNKFIYGLRVPFTSVRLVEFAAPQRGEVVVFIAPMPPHEDYIKRIVAIPGDSIEVRSGVVYVNQQAVPRVAHGDGTFWDRDISTESWHPFNAYVYRETMGSHQFTTLQEAESMRSAEDFRATVVPPGHVFAMGDNRDHSYDSRKWGLVPMSNILGRAMFVLWSWGKDGIDLKRSGGWIE